MDDTEDIEDIAFGERVTAIAIGSVIGLVGSLLGWIACGFFGLVPGGLGAIIGGAFIGSGGGKPGASTALVGGFVMGFAQSLAPILASGIGWWRGYYGDDIVSLLIGNVISVGLTFGVGFVWTLIGFAAGMLMSSRNRS